jgi:aspartate aminotransferase
MLMENVLKFAQARLCPPTLEQLAARAALEIPDSYFEQVLEEYQKRRDLVYDALTSIPGIICQKPKGAFYIIAKLPIEDSEDFARFMLEEFAIDNETVMFAPAAGFYGTEGVGLDEIRIAYVLNTESLQRAMSIFKEGLEAYKSLKE